MGLAGQDSQSPTKRPVIAIKEEIQRKGIAMDVHIKTVKTTEGQKKAPEHDEPKDNLFLILYKDPTAMAPTNRVIFLSRHGESMFNLYGKIGGDANLSAQGLKYARGLAKFFDKPEFAHMKVWTSQLRRTKQTAQYIKNSKSLINQLNEIEAGDFDGMTYEDVADKYPVEFAQRDADKLRYRYPNGESYIDVCRRLCEILPRMNTSENLLVVSHQAVVRCLYTFLMKTPIEELPYVKIPLHTIMKVTFDGTKNIMESTFLNIEAVNTHREKPKNCGKDRDVSEAIKTVPEHL